MILASRAVIPSITLLVLVAFVLLYNCAPSAYFAILAALDIPKATRPFSDIAAVLQAVHCAGQGINVYAPNACMAGGVYNYSPLLLHFTWLGALADHVRWVGISLDFLFIAALTALPAPQTTLELWLRVLASISAATIFVLERANLDAMIFVLAEVGILLCLLSGLLRCFGYALFCLTSALKYYPIVLLLLILRECPRRLIQLMIPLGLGGLGFLLYFGRGTLAAIAIVPHGPPFGNCFGAIDIPLGISLGAAVLHGDKLGNLAQFHMPFIMQLVYAAMILISVWQAVANMALYRQALVLLTPARLVFLIAGTGLVCFCFFLAQNILYRAVFLLLALPGVCTLSTTVPKARWLAIIMVLLMWESLFRVGTLAIMLTLTSPVPAYSATILIWLLREGAWWWMITQCLALLFAYVDAALTRYRAVRSCIALP